MFFFLFYSGLEHRVVQCDHFPPFVPSGFVLLSLPDSIPCPNVLTGADSCFGITFRHKPLGGRTAGINDVRADLRNLFQ